jgi:magnesium transporter
MERHYNQLIDLGHTLEENENDIFEDDKLRYFRRFIGRVERLKEMVTNLKDYATQLRDLIQEKVDVKQNNIMTVLTVITAIFTPLTLITGWYGMNFKYMPELEYKWSYPAVILLSISIVALCIMYIRKKKWM